MNLPDGVVDVRKLKGAGGAAGGRASLIWVVAYSERIELGSRRYEAIQKFAQALKAPRNTDHNVMLLPIASPIPRPEPKPSSPARRTVAARKPAPQKTAPQKTAARKPEPRKPAPRKTAVRKTGPRKPARKPARRKR